MNRMITTLILISVGLFESVSLSNAAWKGVDWNEWVKITQASPPVIQTPQSGRSDLAPLLVSDDGEPIDSIQAWETKRDRILQTLKTMIGEPSDLSVLPPKSEIRQTEDMGNYTRSTIRIRSEKDDWIPAYLLKPDPPNSRPMPVMIVLHQTVGQGKDEPCGIEGNPELAFAAELAERGWICIVPDAIGFGERTPPGAEPYHNALDFFRKHPQWSFFGKMVWDVQRIIDYLETLPEVDPARIGSIGHSHGAYGTIMATVFEPRISAAVASCGFTTLRADPHPNRWSHLTCLIPSVGYYMDNINQAPFDWHEITACIAPRPYLNWATLDDRIFPNTGNLKTIFSDIRNIYAMYGAADRLDARLESGKHSFPRPVRESAYHFLEKNIPPRIQLKNVRNKIPTSPERWEPIRDEIKNLILRDIGPVDPPDIPPVYQTIETEKKDGYIERKIRYHVEEGETVNAYLLIPNDKRHKHPAVIVFHQTTELGKEEPAGHAGRPSIQFGPELVRRGYVVLCPDSICAGERITDSGPYDTRDFYRTHPSQSAMGKMIADGRRAIDILETVPEADPNRIAAIGHSLGAEESLFVSAFDTRIKAAAASCGYAPIRVDKNPGRWARDHWFSYIPRLRVDFRVERLPSWDFDDVIRLIAPRGYTNYQTTDDEIFPEADAAHEFTLATKLLWKLYDAESNLNSILEPGPHDITPKAKEAIYDWIDRTLNDPPASKLWWERETAMQPGGKLVLTDKPWWPKAKKLSAGESFHVRSSEPDAGLMLIRCENRVRGKGTMVVWILDDDGDMDENAPKADLDSDCYIADYGVDGIADRMVDYIDSDSDNVPDEMDIRYFVNGELRNVWIGNDLDGDGEMWDTADYEYTGDFFKSDPYGNGEIYMNKYDPGQNRWLPISECPFAFYDTDGDGESEIALRFSAVPLAFSADDNPDYANNRNRYQGAFDSSMARMGVVNVRYSFDVDGLSRPGEPLHYEMGFTSIGERVYDFDGMYRRQSLRREPKITVCVPHDLACEVAENYTASETGFTWREFPDSSIRIGHPSRPDYDRRWEGVFWTWQRRILHNTGGPVQEWNVRREYGPNETTRREIYYSPFDRRLHLKGASEGWIQIGCIASKEAFGEIRTFDTDSDGYFDRWEYFDAGKTEPYRTAMADGVTNRDFGSNWKTAFDFYNQTVLPEAIKQNETLIATIENLDKSYIPPLPPDFVKALTMTISPDEKRFILDQIREFRYQRFRQIVRVKAESILNPKSQIDPRQDPAFMKRSTFAWSVLSELSHIDRNYECGNYVRVAERIQILAGDMSQWPPKAGADKKK